jgi:hypothetical protein
MCEGVALFFFETNKPIIMVEPTLIPASYNRMFCIRANQYYLFGADAKGLITRVHERIDLFLSSTAQHTCIEADIEARTLLIYFRHTPESKQMKMRLVIEEFVFA